MASGQVDFATDCDRNRTAMIEGGKLKDIDTKVVWTSDPLPNDAIGVRKGFDTALAKRIQGMLVAVTPADAKGILPNHYTGFVAATNDSYKTIRDAAVSLDALKS